MAQNRVDNIQVNAPKDIDNKKGVFDGAGWRCYNSIPEAISVLPSQIRYPTLTINILKAGIPTEYWWRDNITDNGLIEKVTITPDATNAIKGKIKLTNNLGGTADAPTVISVETKPTDDSSTAPASTAFVKGVIAEAGEAVSYTLPKATGVILGGIKIGNGLVTDGVGKASLQVKTINGNSIIGTGNITISGGGGGGGSGSLQDALTIGRIGDRMKITDSMEIPVAAPSVINPGNIWVGAGTSGGGGGGGGSSSVATLTDVTLTSLANNDILKWNNAISKWVNVPIPSGGGGGTWGTITGTLASQTDLNSALLAKQPGLVSGSNIKTINGNSLLGSGDLTISGGGGGSGTVTSVGLSAPTGFSVSGSPITSTGTLTLSFAAGYSLPTNTTQTDWNSAYAHSQSVANPHGTTLQKALTAGRTGDSMKITTSMEIPTSAPGTINAGNVWVGTGTTVGSVVKSKVTGLTDTTGTTLSIGSAQANTYIVSTNASPISATISSGTALTSVFVRQGGAGKITFTGSGVTVLVRPSKSARTEGQNAVVEIFYETTTRVIITGDLDI